MSLADEKRDRAKRNDVSCQTGRGKPCQISERRKTMKHIQVNSSSSARKINAPSGKTLSGVVSRRKLRTTTSQTHWNSRNYSWSKNGCDPIRKTGALNSETSTCPGRSGSCSGRTQPDGGSVGKPFRCPDDEEENLIGEFTRPWNWTPLKTKSCEVIWPWITNGFVANKKPTKENCQNPLLCKIVCRIEWCRNMTPLLRQIESV